jgi:4-aminobutyrate aminotransferase/(S)-3-amino-2-methylpropionate transaminase
MSNPSRRVASVRGPLPGPKSKELIDRWHRFEARSTGYQAPVVWERASGVVVTDVDGNRYIDWTSGVLVTNVGHCHPHLVSAVQEACKKLLNNYDCPNVLRIRAAEAVVRITPAHLDRCFFLTTGSETTEAAIRIMKRKTGRFEILGFFGGFHGRTYSAASVGGLLGTKKGYGPAMPGSIRAPYPYCYRCPFKMDLSRCGFLCLEFLDDVVRANSAGSLAGLLVEPYMGAAGFIFPPEGWLKRLEGWAREREMLFTLDEVQSSYGRTGKMWAAEWDGLEPDLLCIGKGIGSGIPVSCLSARAEVLDVLGVGEMSSTAGGNPVASAAVLAVIDIMEHENLVANALRIGRLMKSRLEEIQEKSKILGDVRGSGLVMGLELVRDKETKEPAPDLTKQVIHTCAESGLLVGSVGIFGNVIRVAPPLVMNETEAAESLDIMEKVLTSF